MAKYRAILMVPCVVEFTNPGDEAHVTAQLRRIASGMGKAESIHPRQPDTVYEPRLVECVLIKGTPPAATPELEIMWTPPATG